MDRPGAEERHGELKVGLSGISNTSKVAGGYAPGNLFSGWQPLKAKRLSQRGKRDVAPPGCALPELRSNMELAPAVKAGWIRISGPSGMVRSLATSPNRPLELLTELAIRDASGVKWYDCRGLICINI